MDALVPDAHLNAAVAGIRGLGRAGLRVIAVGPSWTAAGLWSQAHRRARGGPERDRRPAPDTPAGWRGWPRTPARS